MTKFDWSKVEKPLVLYHGGCRDGWCSAFLAKLRFQDAELVPQQYGDPVGSDAEGRFAFRIDGEQKLIDVTDRDVILLDFTYPRKVLEEMHDFARSLRVLDHHKSATEDLQGLDFAVFDMDRSGCGIALDEFFPGAREKADAVEQLYFEKIPSTPRSDYTAEDLLRDAASLPALNNRTDGITYDQTLMSLTIEDWDLWRFKGDNTKEVCAYLDTVPRTIDAWNALPGCKVMVERGASVLSYQRQQIERIVKHVHFVSWPFGSGVVLNAVNSPVLQSEVGQALYERDPEHAALVWYRNEEMETICSLRSAKGGPDVSEMAKKFGGGGHRNAAGFKLLPSEHENAAWLWVASDRVEAKT